MARNFPTTMPIPQRLEAASQLNPVTGCVEWTRSVNRHGYGQINAQGRRLLAHRAAYEVAFGPVPAGRLVLHRCDNPRCLRPSHLFAGTPRDNVDDMIAKGRGRWRGGRGERHASAKLTAEAVREIRASSELGTVLAERYGVGPTVISRARRGLTWKTVGSTAAGGL